MWQCKIHAKQRVHLLLSTKTAAEGHPSDALAQQRVVVKTEDMVFFLDT